MRKPLIALGLVLSTGFGAIPVASALAATSQSPQHVKGSQPLKGSQPPRNGNGSTTSVPYSSPAPTVSSHSGNAVSGAAIVQTAMKYLGYPYTATGNSPSTGFSCIGFVSFVYRSNGIPLPGDLGNALAYAPQVPFSDLQPGDILYFQNTVWNGLSHAAIYIGGGKFIHAEWYNRGVVVSSFNKDPHDYDYWIGKYLGANRPWSGAAVGPLVTQPPSMVSTAGAQAPTTTIAQPTQIQAGPSALVSVSSLNVRQSPSLNGGVQQVVYKGASMTVLGKRQGWYKVQLADGTIGWVVAAGIGRGANAAGAATVTTIPTGVNGAGPDTTVGNPATPTHLQSPYRRKAVASVKVSGLRVRSEPSTGAQVVTTASQGQRMVVLSRANGWMKVRLADGTVGWVTSAYTSAPHVASSQRPRPSVTASVHARTASTVSVAVNLRSTPSMSGSVLTVVSAGTHYRVLGRSQGWIHVQLADGSTGYVSSGVVRGTYAPLTVKRASRSVPSRTSRSTAGGSILTAGVWVHARPGVKSAVVTLAAAGTHIKVLGYSRGWALVRLPGGATGYVSGSFIR